MPRRQGESFPKSARLRKRSEYLRVQRRGFRVQSGAFVAVLLARNSGVQRIGVTTTRKLGGAVVRNRFRRLVREAFRRRIMVLPDGIDLVVIAKAKATAWSDSQAIFDDLAILGRRISKALEQKPC